MKRTLVKNLHIAANILAVLLIAGFFMSSVIAEWTQDESLIRFVKQTILYLLPLMIVCMATLGATGQQLAGTWAHPDLMIKKSRMKLILMNGMLLIGLAIFLYWKSHFQLIDQWFWLAQLVEWILGAANLTLVMKNAISGRKLAIRPVVKTSY